MAHVLQVVLLMSRLGRWPPTRGSSYNSPVKSSCVIIYAFLDVVCHYACQSAAECCYSLGSLPKISIAQTCTKRPQLKWLEDHCKEHMTHDRRESRPDPTKAIFRTSASRSTINVHLSAILPEWSCRNQTNRLHRTRTTRLGCRLGPPFFRSPDPGPGRRSLPAG